MPESQFYTGRGDGGYTGLLGPERVLKHDLRPEAYGTVDEAQAALGLVRASGCTQHTGDMLLAVQRDLYTLMSILAAAGVVDSPGTVGGPESAFHPSRLKAQVARLEDWIGELEGQVSMPREFVVPGDSPAGAALHLARTIVRRAERAVVRLLASRDGLQEGALAVAYLNRLSSLLFVLAVFEDEAATAHRPTPAKL